MKYICVTEVDNQTKTPCIEEPQKNGPSMPDVKGLVIKWADQSTWPVSADLNGKYLRAPKYYGICDDDADVSVKGVLEILTEQEWLRRKEIEFIARRPYPSWILVEDKWIPPIQKPFDAIVNGGSVVYVWNEHNVNWFKLPPKPSDAIINGGTVPYEWDEVNLKWKPI